MALTQFNWEFFEKKWTISKINDYYESNLENDLRIPFKIFKIKLIEARNEYTQKKSYFKK